MPKPPAASDPPPAAANDALTRAAPCNAGKAPPNIATAICGANTNANPPVAAATAIAPPATPTTFKVLFSK